MGKYLLTGNTYNVRTEVCSISAHTDHSEWGQCRRTNEAQARALGTAAGPRTSSIYIVTDTLARQLQYNVCVYFMWRMAGQHSNDVCHRTEVNVSITDTANKRGSVGGSNQPYTYIDGLMLVWWTEREAVPEPHTGHTVA